MDNFPQLMRDAFQYFDNGREKYEKKIKKFKYFYYNKYDNDIDSDYIIFNDENGKEIFRSRYGIIGQFTQSTNTWVWAWSVPDTTKKETQLSRNILNYGFDLNLDHISLKTALITSRFRITNRIQLDFYLALASYLCQIPLIFKVNIPISPTMSEKLIIKSHAETEKMLFDERSTYIMLLDYDKLL